MNYILNVIIGIKADPAGAMFLICPGIPAALLCFWFFAHLWADRPAKEKTVNSERRQWPFNNQP